VLVHWLRREPASGTLRIGGVMRNCSFRAYGSPRLRPLNLDWLFGDD